MSTRTMLKSKIHRARVTDCNIDYEGSITIDTYCLMGLKTLGIALTRGHLSLETAGEIREVLEGRGQRPSSYYDDLYQELGIDFESRYSSARADKLI